MGEESISSDEHTTDASFLSGLDKSVLQQFLDYSLGSLNRVQTKFAALDSKASQSMGLISIVGGILVFGLPPAKVKSNVGDSLLSFGVLCLLCSALCSLLCLRVRLTIEPPTIKRAVEWLHAQDKNRLAVSMLSALIIDLANAERSHIQACESKSKVLSIGQALQLIGIAFLFAWFLLAKLT